MYASVLSDIIIRKLQQKKKDINKLARLRKIYLKFCVLQLQHRIVSRDNILVRIRCTQVFFYKKYFCTLTVFFDELILYIRNRSFNSDIIEKNIE